MKGIIAQLKNIYLKLIEQENISMLSNITLTVGKSKTRKVNHYLSYFRKN